MQSKPGSIKTVVILSEGEPEDFLFPETSPEPQSKDLVRPGKAVGHYRESILYKARQDLLSERSASLGKTKGSAPPLRATLDRGQVLRLRLG